MNDFNREFVSGFPAGWAERHSVLEYLHLPDARLYVPILVFIDRDGMIRAQYIGDEDFPGGGDKDIRTLADNLLNNVQVATPGELLRPHPKGYRRAQLAIWIAMGIVALALPAIWLPKWFHGRPQARSQSASSRHE